jgi:hypothetical protein
MLLADIFFVMHRGRHRAGSRYAASVDETVSWTITAFSSNPDATDDAIAELLVAHGVPEGLAARAVLMLPLAFGRRVLRGMVTLPDEIQEGEQVRVLSEDPVFAAAARRAERASRDELQRIGLVSCEVNAVAR